MVFYGGGGSGKSYFAAQKLLIRIMTEKRHRILVIRKVARTLRLSVFALIREIIGDWGIADHFDVNKTDMMIRFRDNGNEIIFAGLDDPEKIKSIQGITSIWIEEATELAREDFMQLNIRLRGITETYKQIILSFNPINQLHWIYNYFFTNPDKHIRENTDILKTTYRDNTKLDIEYAGILEGLAGQDENYYNIYAKGEWGQLAELIYKPFPIILQYPEFFDERIYGLDFGFNVATALTELGIKDGGYYTDEVIYQKGLTNSDLIELMGELGISKTAPIYADAAEPQRIEEIFRAGYLIYPADKSVKDGIDHVKRRRIFSKASNVNINKEVQGYSYKKDKDGNILEEPVKFLDHAMDSIRYAVHTHHKYLEGIPPMDIQAMDAETLRKIVYVYMEEKGKLIAEAIYTDEQINQCLMERLKLDEKQFKELAEYVKSAYNY
jgi:phage terminase large subunit